jgi:antitoxin component YwqK of YwqJK toxin-antitoxin module
MALRIAAADNFAWLKDIHDPELPAWQQASGLSMEELKLIQGAYDYYIPNAHLLVNKYEVPQQPECVMRYFESPGKKTAAKPENIWCYGEGKNGVLHGKWIQNYAAGMPWIVGYYENGKRSGQWEEYYQGTKQLCRTEIWRNDKLNGVRKRYDRSGILIEEILFRDGAAITKTNYDREASLMWVRKPLDSNRVYTEVYTLGGALIASGHEIVHNPGNLQWFQNIELTALNSFSLPSSTPSFSIGGFGANLNITPTFGGSSLYSTPPLVEYKKEGEWKFYKEYQLENPRLTASGTMKGWLSHNYPHFAHELMRSLMSFDDFKINASYDSILVVYSNNHVRELYGYAPADYTHLEIRYHAQNEFPDVFSVYSIWNFSQFYQPMVVKEIGQYNRNRERIGAWKHYDESGRLYKVENFILPWKEENESLVSLKAPK